MSKIHENFIRLLQISQNLIPEYVDMLRDLSWDRNTDAGDLWLGLLRAPAATRRHHSREGGLVQHYLEMWDAYLTMRVLFFSDESPWKKGETDIRVLKGIINHDLHKAYNYYKLVSENPWKAEYTKSDTRVLLTDNHATLYILEQYGVKMDIIDRNILLNSEGGWCEVETKEVASIAKLVYLLDDLSGNVLDRLKTGHHVRQDVNDDKRTNPNM